MALSDALLPEFDHEMANTRRTIERVPDEKLDWKPHEKSMSMIGLATHLSNLPSWAVLTVNADSFDMAPGGKQIRVPPAGSREEAVAMFDKNVGEARAAIAQSSDEHLREPWSLLMDGKTIFKLPRIAVLRSMVMNHMIHHRAQLGVYLRLNDIPVPSIYGPSADEG